MASTCSATMRRRCIPSHTATRRFRGTTKVGCHLDSSTEPWRRWAYPVPDYLATEAPAPWLGGTWDGVAMTTARRR